MADKKTVKPKAEKLEKRATPRILGPKGGTDADKGGGRQG
jgi:hypothetical protein